MQGRARHEHLRNLRWETEVSRISEAVRQGCIYITSKFDRLSETILAEVKQANDTAKEAMNIAVAAQAS